MLMEQIQPTTETLQLQEDILQAAGSKMSFTDILNKEHEIPLYRNGKFYKTEDVLRVFVTLNGVLKDVSTKAYSNKEQVEELRREIGALQDEITSRDAQIEQLELEMSTAINTSEADVLRDKVKSLENQLYDRQQETEQHAATIQEQITALTDAVIDAQDSEALAVADRDRVQLEVEDLRSQCNLYRAQANDYRAKVNALEAQLESVKAQLDDAHDQYGALELKMIHVQRYSKERIQQLLEQNAK